MQNVDNSSPSICDASVKQKDLKVNYGETVHLSCPLHVNDLSETTAKYGPLKWYFYPDGRTRYQRNSQPSVVEVTNRRDKYALTTDNGLVILGTTDRENGRYECKLGSSPLIRYEVFVDSSKYIVSCLQSNIPCSASKDTHSTFMNLFTFSTVLSLEVDSLLRASSALLQP